MILKVTKISSDNNKVYLKDMEIGQLFRYGDDIFLKTETLFVSGNPYCAVGLTGMYRFKPVIFRSEDRLLPIDGELTING